MQFTRLRLQGFKSFVDPTDLVISPGLTGIVGPNGCGKSNLLEALRWVMGENSAKQVRGEDMEDVIFAGAESRPARNNASVDLVIDNGDRRAPAAFNDADSLDLSRRITRGVGSAYTLNGRNVRARDVQILLADASTGVRSPALVGQGQIANLIDAKPKVRRRLLEEAAGISGLYQRRREAELKLNAAENNLARVDDVLENLDDRLRALDRQAGQARRYREIADELRKADAVLLFLRWSEADVERLSLEEKLRAALAGEAQAEGNVLRAGEAKTAADAALLPLREEAAAAAAAHQRLAIEGEQLEEAERRAITELEGLAERIRVMGLDIDREKTLGGDAVETIARLDEEAKTLKAEHADHPKALAEATREADAAGRALSERESTLDRLTETAARIAARIAAAERRRDEAAAACERIARDIEAARTQKETLGVEIADAEKALDAARAEEAAGRDGAKAAEAALLKADTALREAQSMDAKARSGFSEAGGAADALAAEVRALEALLTQEADGRERLIDQIRVAAGYEAALGAALGDDLHLGLAKKGSGWRDLGAISGGEIPNPLSAHVSGPSALNRRLARVGLVADLQAGDEAQAGLAPGQRLVSRNGDLWRWDGVRVRVGDATSAAAHRLQRRNRIAARKAALAEAETSRAAAEAACADADARLTGAAATEKACREARRLADQAVAEAVRAVSRAEADLDMQKGRLEARKTALEDRMVERKSAEAALNEAMAAAEDPGDAEEARAAVERWRGKVDLARETMLSARSILEDLRRRGAARGERIADMECARAEWVERRDNAAGRVEELARRIEEAETSQRAASSRPAELEEKRSTLRVRLDQAETRRRAGADALAAAETAQSEAGKLLRDAERKASECREDRARAEVMRDAAAAKVEDAVSAIAAELDMSPAALPEAAGFDPAGMPDAARAEAETVRLRRQRDNLGAVNLRAEEDAAEIREERDALAAEKEELNAAIAKLRSGIGDLNREGRRRLVQAFDRVNEKFSDLFRHLFGGGEARLVMVESDDPLDAGLEIVCRPPGKKRSTLSLLSGGERTLTALSLIFSVFLSNPAPICVLDEADAPLDDSNVIRFCNLLDEMVRRTKTRFLIITHHAITTSRMNRLFGVTMVERGVSQLVSVDLARAGELVEG